MTCAAAIGLPLGMFIYAWCAFSFVHWIGQCVGIAVCFLSHRASASCVFTFADLSSRYSAGRFSRCTWQRFHISQIGESPLRCFGLVLFSRLIDGGWTCSYGPYASSALAGQSLARQSQPFPFSRFLVFLSDRRPSIDYSALILTTGNVIGTVFPMFTDRMFNALGYRWATTLFGLIACVMIPVPFVRLCTL